MKTKITVLALILSLGMSAFAADSPVTFGKKRKKDKTEKCCSKDDKSAKCSSETSKKTCKTEAEKGASCCAKKS